MFLDDPDPDNPLEYDIAHQWKVNKPKAVETGTYLFLCNIAA